MAQYLLPCSCGQKVRVENAQAGGEVVCACGQRLSVPTLRGMRQLEVAAAVASPSRPGWSGLHGSLFALGLTAVGIGLAVLAYLLLRYGQISSSVYAIDRSADVVSALHAEIETLTPVQALELWSHEAQEGLGDRQTPPWVLIKEKIAEYAFWAKLAASLLTAGALLCVATLFLGRPRK